MRKPLDRIEIEGFRSIEKAVVPLGKLNVLIGANGGGKSNFIGVFAFLRQVHLKHLQETVRLAGGADRFLRFGRKVTPVLRLLLHFGRNEYQASFQSTDDGALLLTEHANFDGPHYGRSQKVIGTNVLESQLPEHAQAYPESQYAYVQTGLLAYRLFHFHDTGRAAPLKQAGPIDDNEALHEDGSNVAAVLYRMKLKEPMLYARLLGLVRLVAPFFDDFDLHPGRIDESAIKLEWKEKNRDAYLDAHALSDGTLRFICLATMLLQPERPSVFVVDEPELGLHPVAIQLLAGLFRSVADEFGVQIIAATQSPVLVSQLEPEDIVVVERDVGGASTFRRLASADVQEWLETYSLGELWEKNLLGGRPR